MNAKCLVGFLIAFINVQAASPYEADVDVSLFAGDGIARERDGVGTNASLLSAYPARLNPRLDSLVFSARQRATLADAKVETVGRQISGVTLSGTNLYAGFAVDENDTMYLPGIVYGDGGYLSVISISSFGNAEIVAKWGETAIKDGKFGTATVKSILRISDAKGGRFYFCDDGYIRCVDIRERSITTATNIGRHFFPTSYDQLEATRDGGFIILRTNTLKRFDRNFMPIPVPSGFGTVRSISEAPDGSIVFADDHIVKRFRDGTFSSIAGTSFGVHRVNGIGRLAYFRDIAQVFATDSAVYVTEYSTNQVRKISIGTQPSPVEASLEMYPGVTIPGVIGRRYRIERANTADALTWEDVGTMTLEKSPQTWFDQGAANQPRRFYRAILLP